MELWGEHMSQLLQLQCQGLNDYGIVISSLFEASGKSTVDHCLVQHHADSCS